MIQKKSGKTRNENFLESISSAFEGLGFALKEKNIIIQTVFFFLTSFVAFFLPLSSSERIIVIMLCGIVISFELINTAFEKFIDFHVKNFDPEIKVVKDIAAGAVLIVSLTALIIGLWIFGKYLI